MRPLPFLLLSTTLLAQEPPDALRRPQLPSGAMAKLPPAAEPRSNPVPAQQVPLRTDAVAKLGQPAQRNRLAAAAADAPASVVFDQPTNDGPLWALGADYKANFAGDRWSYIARPRDGADHLQPLTFHLAGVRVDGESLPLAKAAAASRDGDRVHLQHGAVTETLALSRTGIEQSFTLATLPQRGELVVDIDLDSELAGSPAGRGLCFTSEWMEVHYGAAIAIDANGARCDAATRLVDGRIEIRVPQAFVAAAVLPLVIDPLVANGIVTSGTADVGNPDIVWAPGVGQWIACYQKLFAAGDWDCWVQRLDNNLLPVGSPVAIDYTSNSWYRPRIAHLTSSGLSLVVCELHLGSNAAKVTGRIHDNSLSMTTGQFDISSAPVASLTPDVGADCHPGGGYFTVVWEHAFSASDHDIYARQVTNTGTLRGTSPTYIDGSTSNETNPSISKSDGGPNYANQRYAIVYQRQSPSFDQDIRGALLTWDGVIQIVAGSNNFPINTSFSNNVLPNVSSPSLSDVSGRRIFLCAYENTGSNAGDIEMSAFDDTGAVLAIGNVVALEGSLTRLSWPQHYPSVECDGTRFVVGYHENYYNSTTDLDARVATVTYGSGQLFAADAAAPGLSGAPEFAVQIASCYSSGAAQNPTFATVNDRDSAGSYYIDADRYDLVPSGYVFVRSTSCGGGVNMTSSGNALPGNTVTMSITSSSPIAGFIAGAATSGSLPGCSCIVGVDSYFMAIGSSLPITIPATPTIIGARLSVQGLMLGAPGSSCLFDIHLSDTFDVLVQ